MDHHMLGASIRAAVASESAEYARSEVREVVDGERDRAACQVLDAAGEIATYLEARREARGLVLELWGYARRKDALAAVEVFFNRYVKHVRDTDTYAPELASCEVAIVPTWEERMIAAGHATRTPGRIGHPVTTGGQYTTEDGWTVQVTWHRGNAQVSDVGYSLAHAEAQRLAEEQHGAWGPENNRAVKRAICERLGIADND